MHNGNNGQSMGGGRSSISSRPMMESGSGSDIDRRRGSSRVNLFRKIIGQKRNEDYVADAPEIRQTLYGSAGGKPHIAAHLQSRRSRNMSGRMDPDSTTMSSGGKAGTSRKRLCVTSEHQYRIELLLRTQIFRFMMVFFTLVLLFGSQIKVLWLPKSSDNVLDILLLCGLGFFVLEIILRTIVNRKYFSPKSFLFLCDLCSTLAVFYEIEFINRLSFKQIQHDITVDQFGIPMSGLRENLNFLHRPLPNIEFSMLIVIVKSARAARLVRSTKISKLSSKVNWYWFTNPSAIRHSCLRMCGGRRHNFAASQAGGRTSALEDGSSVGLSGTSLGAGSAPHDVDDSTAHGMSSKASLVRRSSWGGLGFATLAAVKAHRLAREAEEEKAKSLWGKVERLLRVIGLLNRNDQEWRRHLAASKIQRAWRKAVQRNAEFDFGDSNVNDGISGDSHDKSMWRRSAQRKLSEGSAYQSKRFFTSPDSEKKSASAKAKKNQKSQVGTAMRELTEQRVAVGIICALLLTVLFTYTESNLGREATMVMLHSQTKYSEFAERALDSAREGPGVSLFNYSFANGTIMNFTVSEIIEDLRNREIMNICVKNFDASDQTCGQFTFRTERETEALVELITTIYILLVWLFGIQAFTGPIMILVVLPIERMIRLLTMLMVDPLGYQSTAKYRKFVDEEEELTKNTRWTKEVLKGMETSFLMSTILRIGSLMKVGFGSAGVEIIRQNLDKEGGSKSQNIISNQGTTVSCIFLFSDIRQFTDATESLQEEVFRFTNRIAAVVHSYCHAYGGSANKNIGDAFLLSWMLDDSKPQMMNARTPTRVNQADKALLAVVKICMALYHDEFYIEDISQTARDALLGKLSKRKGPVVQMGFGMHAGTAVQGAIGSERKIDATYVSEAVEFSEFLESSTKTYGLKVLMSDAFHRLLDPNNRRRCRKIDQIVVDNNDSDDEDEDDYNVDILDLYTFDMHIEALWEPPKDFVGGVAGGVPVGLATGGEDSASEGAGSAHDVFARLGSKRGNAMVKQQSGSRMNLRRQGNRRISLMVGVGQRGQNNSPGDIGGQASQDFMNSSIKGGGAGASIIPNSPGSNPSHLGKEVVQVEAWSKPVLVLPTGPALYNPNAWLTEDLKKIRARYLDGQVFQKYHSGLQSFYARDWKHAKNCFQIILDKFEDGPSRYFMKKIEEHGGRPPNNFLGYGKA